PLTRSESRRQGGGLVAPVRKRSICRVYRGIRPRAFRRIAPVGHSVTDDHSAATVLPRCCAAVSGGFHCNLLRLFRSGIFWERERQDAVLEVGVDLVSINVFRKTERSLERAEAALRDVVVFLLFLPFLLLLPSDG